MKFSEPLKNVFTIYSKSGCFNCTRVKTLLSDKKYDFTVIDCDEYLLEDKEGFLSFIKDISKREHRTFPIVFSDGHFIGGFLETQQWVEKNSCFDDNDF